MKGPTLNNMHNRAINNSSKTPIDCLCKANIPLRKGSLLEKITTETDKESITESVITQDDTNILSTKKQKAHSTRISLQSNRKFSTQSDRLNSTTACQSIQNETRILPIIAEKENIPTHEQYGHYIMENIYPVLEENVAVGSNMQPAYGCVMMLVGNCIFLLGVIEHLPVIKLDLEKLYSIKSFEGTNTDIMCINYPNKRPRSFYTKHCNKRSRDTWFNSIVKLVC
jgi:hypothetical protein